MLRFSRIYTPRAYLRALEILASRYDVTCRSASPQCLYRYAKFCVLKKIRLKLLAVEINGHFRGDDVSIIASRRRTIR